MGQLRPGRHLDLTPVTISPGLKCTLSPVHQAIRPKTAPRPRELDIERDFCGTQIELQPSEVLTLHAVAVRIVVSANDPGGALS
jgi:hypothetical protein